MQNTTVRTKTLTVLQGEVCLTQSTRLLTTLLCECKAVFVVALLALATPSAATQSSIDRIPDDDPLGNFRTFCDFSHAAMDDPIVSPDQPGAAHLHFFFGNTGTNAFTDSVSLRRKGRSTCQGTQLNKSAYWIPALFNALGKPMLPSTTDIYYKNQTVEDPQTIVALPRGLRMIAGDATGLENDPYHETTAWWCESAGVGTRTDTIPTCAIGDRLRLFIRFPHCWDGIRLDSDDHKSHMANAVWSNEAQGQLCPDSHPVVVPRISYNFTWRLRESSQGWYIASDRHHGRNLPNGSTLHGDWWNGWHQPTMEAFTQHCLRETRDCANGDLGNGFVLDRRYDAGTGIIRFPAGADTSLIYCNGRRATLVGTNGNDTLTGTDRDDVIVSFAGDDTIRGGGGDDVICAGAGADLVYAGSGDDEVRAGSGNDEVYGEDGDDRIWGQSGNDQLTGGDDDDALQGGAGNDTLIGGPGYDYLSGGRNNDQLNGGLLDDVLDGGPGADVLDGSWQQDRLYGGSGPDVLNGAQGNDRLWGGPGIDRCDGGPALDRVYTCE